MVCKKIVFIITLVLLAMSQGTRADDYALRRSYDVLFLEAMVQRQQMHHAAAFDLLRRCTQLRPDASEAWFFLSAYYDQLKQPDKALEMVERAAKLDPDNTFYKETLARQYLDQEQYAEGTELLEQVYDHNKDRQDLLETLYQLYAQMENYPKAVATLERIETIDGVSPQLSMSKLSLLWKMDDKDGALEEARLLSLRHPEESSFATIYADMLVMADQPDKAYTVLEKVLREEPDNSTAQLSLRNYFVSKDDTLAADSIETACLFNPKAPTDTKINLLRRRIALSNSVNGDSTEILSLFRRLIAQPPFDVDIASLCVAYMNLKKMPHDSITPVLQLILQRVPDEASARLELVQYAWQEDNYQRIVELCQQARQYNPEEMVFYYYQGIAYLNLKDNDHALEAFENGISVINENTDPTIAGEFYSALGDLLHEKGRYAEAFKAYDKCLEVAPDNVGCLNNYAYFLSLRGERLDEAEQMSHKAIAKEPHNATYLDTYAWILFLQKRTSEANIYMEEALKNFDDPDHVMWEHAGDIAFVLGNNERAVECWNKALEKLPGNKALQKKIKKNKNRK